MTDGLTDGLMDWILYAPILLRWSGEYYRKDVKLFVLITTWEGKPKLCPGPYLTLVKYRVDTNAIFAHIKSHCDLHM